MSEEKPKQDLKSRLKELSEERIAKLSLSGVSLFSGAIGFLVAFKKVGAEHPAPWVIAVLGALAFGLLYRSSTNDTKKLESLEKNQTLSRLIELALQKRGYLTLAEAVSSLSLTLEEAQEGLEKLVQTSACQLKDHNGLQVYYFAEFEDQYKKQSTPIEEAILQAARRHNGKATASTLASDTGLPLDAIHNELDRLVRANRCKLQINEEGSLVYSLLHLEQPAVVEAGVRRG